MRIVKSVRTSDKEGMQNMIEGPANTASVHLGWRRLSVLACCLLLTMIDGFDTQAIGFVGPAIVHAWHLPPASLGPIFSAGLLGALFGAVGFGRLGDRHGRLTMLVCSVLVFAAGTILTAWVTRTNTLLVMRFFTGIGLGGALPNLLALTAAQAPAHLRSTSIATVLIGLGLGAGIGGFASVSLIQAYGWQTVFLMGGLAPLPILPVLAALLIYAPSQLSEQSSTSLVRGGFAAVLSRRYRAGTLLLWAVNCCCSMLTYTLASWLPTLLNERGFAVRQAVTAAALLNLGGVLGGICCGRLSDMRGPYPVIIVAYFLGGIAIAMIGSAAGFGFGAVLAAVFATALFAYGGQTGVGVLSTIFYEAPLRSTGVGLALGFGRVGAVTGPLLIGWLLAAGTAISTLFLIGGSLAILISLLIAAMGYASGGLRTVQTAA
jgi:AAHS family 4-hydroxybenzoate transporter-like MFS transporter